MFGYACRETPELMPAPIYYAHRILTPDERGAEVRRGPAARTRRQKPGDRHLSLRQAGRATSIVVSTQHLDEALTSDDVRQIVEPIVRTALPEDWIDADTVWHVNPTGKFVIGGPDGDCGLTGRKIIVDTYGGAAPHGGGAFSGKDPTKVDRSAAYAARYLAKNVVAAGLADRCTIQLAYAIGVSQPLSIYVDLHGTGNVEEERLEKALAAVMDLSPRGIRQHLGLTGRSMPAPRPMAISAARRKPTAASPGSGSIWSRRSAKRSLSSTGSASCAIRGSAAESSRRL